MESIKDIFPEYKVLNKFFIEQDNDQDVKMVSYEEEFMEIFEYAESYFMRIYKNYRPCKYRYLYYTCVIVASKYLDDYDESLSLKDFVDYYFLHEQRVKNHINYLRKFEISVLKDLEYRMNK